MKKLVSLLLALCMLLSLGVASAEIADVEPLTVAGRFACFLPPRTRTFAEWSVIEPEL